MEFHTYYNNDFRSELNTFLNTIPDESRYHHNIETRNVVTIQLDRLTSNHHHLDFLNEATRINFAHALYWTILVDMVMYTHFNGHYNNFQKLTKYPKLIGNCTRGCYHHYHPRNIYDLMDLGMTDEEINSSIFSTKAYITSEIESFVSSYLPEISVSQFLSKINDELV
jgi:hypothetical protein